MCYAKTINELDIMLSSQIKDYDEIEELCMKNSIVVTNLKHNR